MKHAKLPVSRLRLTRHLRMPHRSGALLSCSAAATVGVTGS